VAANSVRSEKIAQIPPAIDHSDELDRVVCNAVLAEQQVAALDQHAETGPDVIAQGAHARGAPKQLQLTSDPSQKTIRGAPIIGGDKMPDFV
jgi:hypothetical protein